MLIRNATVLTAAGPELTRASVLLAGGKVVAVGADTVPPPGTVVVDGTNKYVTPGLIDTHRHLGVYPAPGSPSQADGNEDVPRFDGLAARLDNATLLREAGVTVVAAQRDLAQFRDLRQAAGSEVRNGMSWDEALRSVTQAPAAALGIADRYGSLQPGQVANVVIWSGDPFEFSSQVERLFIRGVQVPLVSRQTELFERYKQTASTLPMKVTLKGSEGP